VRLLALLHAPCLSAHPIERRQRGVEMTISGRFCSGLTVQEPRELCAVTAEKLDLETRGVEVDQCMTMQLRIRRAQNDETRRGRVFPVQEHHKTQAPLQRLVPHYSGIQVPMRLIFSCTAILETASVLDVALAVILALCPASLRVRTCREQHAVGVAPQLGDRVQTEADDCITILLLRIGAIHAMRGDARRQAMPMRTQLLRVEVDPSFVLLGLRRVLPRRRL